MLFRIFLSILLSFFNKIATCDFEKMRWGMLIGDAEKLNIIIKLKI